MFNGLNFDGEADYVAWSITAHDSVCGSRPISSKCQDEIRAIGPDVQFDGNLVRFSRSISRSELTLINDAIQRDIGRSS